MKKTTAKTRFGDKQVKHRTTLVDDVGEDYPAGSLLCRVRQNSFLREVVQNPDVLNCGPMPFSKLVMKHNGTRWQIDAESDAEEEIDT